MITGIDVSSWQKQIDWKQVKAGGVTFAYIKATEGTSYRNPRFPRDWSQAKQVGILRGAYHFFDPSKPVAAQVKHFVSVLGPLNDGDLPPALDLEGDWSAIPVATRLPLVMEFLQELELVYGIAPIIYTGFYFARDILRTADTVELRRYKLWIANYNKVADPKVPLPWTHWSFWQFSNTGRVPGIWGNVDRNKFPGSLEDLERIAKHSGPLAS